MLADLEKHTARFNDLSLRSRLLMTLSSVVILFVLFDLYWFSNNEKTIKQTNNNIISLSQEKDNLIEVQKTTNGTLSELLANVKRSNKILMMVNIVNIATIVTLLVVVL